MTLPHTLKNLNISALKVLCVVVFVGFYSMQTSAQQLTYEQFKTKAKSIVAENDDPSKLLLKYTDDNAAKAFVSKNDWYRAMRFCVMEAEKTKGEYFAELSALVGKRMHNNGYYEDAFYFLFKADKCIREHPPKDKKFIPFFHESFGLAFYYYKRYEEAKVQFRLASDGKEWSNNQRIGILNTFGLIFRDQNNSDSARYYFQRGLEMAQRTKDIPWTGVISGNLGHLYYLEGNLDKAYEMCEIDFSISVRYNQYGSALNAGYLLIKMDLDRNRLGTAEKRMAFMDSLVETLEYNMSNSRVVYDARTLMYQAQGNYKAAFESYRIAELYRDTLSKLSAEENLKRTQFQIDFEQKQAELTILQERKKFDEFVIGSLIVLTGLIIFFFVWAIRSIQKRRKRERELSELQRERVKRDLENTEREMRQMLSNLIEKNELIEQLTTEIEEFNQGAPAPVSEERLKMMDKLQSFTLLTDDDWLEFKKLFERLNPDFFHKVMTHSPDLTNAEIRLITLIKLNLSNLEMSRALGISPDSVRKTSLRLRKKWNMDQPEELVKFILSL